MEKTTYKATLRIPTKEMYSFIELQIESEPAKIIDIYLEMTALYWTKYNELQEKLKEQEQAKPPF